jgi:hypothetical protein
LLRCSCEKHWNKLKERSTADMDGEELKNHRIELKIIKKDLNFMKATAEEEEDMDEDYDE